MQLRQVLADAASLLGRMSEYPLLEHVRREQLRRASDDDARGRALNNLGSAKTNEQLASYLKPNISFV